MAIGGPDNGWMSAIQARIDALLPLLLPASAPYSREGPDSEGRVWYVYGNRRAFFEPTSLGFVISVYSAELKDGTPLAKLAALSDVGPLAMLLAVALTA